MENPEAVRTKILELNRESWEKSGRPAVASVPDIWTPIDGYTALTSFDFNNGSYLFNANRGFPLKGFMNTTTGEVRVYNARLFEV